MKHIEEELGLVENRSKKSFEVNKALAFVNIVFSAVILFVGLFGILQAQKLPDDLTVEVPVKLMFYLIYATFLIFGYIMTTRIGR